MGKPKITVVGSLNMDLVTETSRFPEVGETITGESFQMTPGGKGANQAVAMAKLGADVHMIGAVGDDVFGKQLVENLKQAGVQVDAIETVDDSTGIAAITVGHGDNHIIIVAGANNHVDEKMIEKNKELLMNSDYVVLQLEIPISTVKKTIEIASAAGVKIILDPAPIQPLPKEIVSKVDYFTPNEHEYKQLLEQGVRPEQVILTKGSEGIRFTENGVQQEISAHRVDVVDTTGAGDSFAGAFTVALSEGKSVREACEFGNVVGAFATTKLGAQAGMPSRDEVERFIGEICKKTQ